MIQPTAQELLKAKDVAKLLNTTPAMLANWRCSGDARISFVRVGRAIRYKLQDVLDFIDSHTVNPSDEAIA